MNLSALPNILTVIRIILVVPFVMLLLADQFTSALVVFIAAGLSDGLDGLLARRFGWVSRFGEITDPIADKLLMVCSYSTLCYLQMLPWWLFVLILLRELLIVGGAYCYHHLFGAFKVAPTFLSKANTFLQILLVVLAIALHAFNWPYQSQLQMMIYLVMTSTILSGAQYAMLWGSRAFNNIKQDNFRDRSHDS
jgi:cardiolipin synthase (CMP-forming)